MMRILQVTTASVLATALSFPTMADSEHHPEEAAASSSDTMPMAGGTMPMAGGTMPMAPGQGGMMGKGAMPMMDPQQGGMMNPQMMHNMMAMRQKHMLTMETHMANIEALLRQLVELQKQQ